MSDHEDRLIAIRQELPAQDLDALVVSEAGNRRWLTGFTGSAGWPVVTRSDACLLTDSRYFEQVEREAPAFRLERVTGRRLERLGAFLTEQGLLRVGFERDVVTVGELETLRQHAPAVRWTATTGLVERHRAVKTTAEVARIAAAATLGDQAMAIARADARPGMTERELAWVIERYMREHGAEAVAFPVIVAAGENSALPHHRASDRPIAAGEPIVIDLGATLDGYNGDLTRTFCLGPPRDPAYERVYRVVAAANRAAAEGIRPGMNGREADALARTVIVDAGYGDHFGHGLGHGVGLNVHELPVLGPNAEETPLREGMVATIEPGVYLPGRFGVRLEDLAVLEASGPRVLSAAPKHPVVELLVAGRR